MGLTANELWVLKSIAGSNPVTSANVESPARHLVWLGIILCSTVSSSWQAAATMFKLCAANPLPSMLAAATVSELGNR